jgi:prevent-host-death family protein
VCYVKEITHRQMRNESGDVLRRVAAGESILVTNNGQPAAVIAPPPTDVLAMLTMLGQLRRALQPPSTLLALSPRTSDETTAEILADVRGRW